MHPSALSRTRLIYSAVLCLPLLACAWLPSHETEPAPPSTTTAAASGSAATTAPRNGTAANDNAKANTSSTPEQQQECTQLRSEIRDNQRAARQAPSTSISPEIVAAAQAKADRNIDNLQQQLADLDCPADNSPPLLTAPLPPPPPGSPRY